MTTVAVAIMIITAGDSTSIVEEPCVYLVEPRISAAFVWLALILMEDCKSRI
jgi:hypothetical protein